MSTERIGSVVIEAVEPQLDGGRYPVKRVAGEPLVVSADIFKEGHDLLAAVVRWRQVSPRPSAPSEPREVPMAPLGNDRWMAQLPLEHPGRYVFTVEAWADSYRSFTDELSRKLKAGREVKSELLEGAALLEAAAARAKSTSTTDAERLFSAAAVLQGPPAKAAAAALDPTLVALASGYPDRALATRFDRELAVWIDREKAQTGAWYELFPRSASGDARRHGTFQDVQRRLPDIQAMGFDVLYLPPIHPIGRTARKGKNNALAATAEDVGSPWAIGAVEGGHREVHPALGTLEDFRALVKAAGAHGIEIALDLAFQCSPDHPYVKAHPEWFQHRPDGTIKTAENPPKRYEDIVNFDWLGPARESLWEELKSVVLHWVEQGVTIFRVDNPHTKPLPFWVWLIEEVQEVHPEVVFLAEAFTRPKVMKALAKAGFSQSYTYFTWRNFKLELEDYLTELTQGPAAEYMRGNLWPNTPDILPEFLQQGGPPAFKLRVILAATLSSSYGIYQSYELCEGRGIPGTEEYQDSEKYELKAWDLARPGNIREEISKLNRIRRENPALRLYKNLRFYRAHNSRIVFYGKSTADLSNQILCAVSLDPHQPQEAILEIPLKDLGLTADQSYQVHELLSDERSLWQGHTAHVKLTPERPARIWAVRRFIRSERGFDYYND